MQLAVGEQYDITFGSIGENHFSWLEGRGYAGWVVFVDTNTHELCLPLLSRHLRRAKTSVIVAPQGEPHKHLGTCRELWQKMFDAGVGRRWCAICLGGGVLADMAGFVAGTYKRGIDFLQIPTTLVSQVDSSVGGKLGVDFNNLKNSIGLFRDPVAVWIDPVFLKTLPDRELRSGYAEMIKHALIADAGQWKQLSGAGDWRQNDWASLTPPSVAIKRDIVIRDPFESGPRKALNFGHTVGHALEAYWLRSENRLLHGEAIAAGMIVESWLSHHSGSLSDTELAEISGYLLGVYGHQFVPEGSFPQLLEFMRQDKKNEDDRINFTLLDGIGNARVNATAPASAIAEGLRFYNAFGKEVPG